MYSFYYFEFRRLQGEAARANSSDDSTDSEEELDSPNSIPQQHIVIASANTSVSAPSVSAVTEKMDVDSSEGISYSTYILLFLI